MLTNHAPVAIKMMTIETLIITMTLLTRADS
jgi:hypothetical protein